MSSQYCCRGRLVGAAALLLALGFVLSSRLNAQGSTSATVLGTVTDSAGAVVPNAAVQVKNTRDRPGAAGGDRWPGPLYHCGSSRRDL